MNKIFLLGLTLVWAGCQPEKEILPTTKSMASEVSGQYQTNGYLDLRSIPLTTNQLPTANIEAQSDSEITLTLLERYPTAQRTTLHNVVLRRQADSSILLNYQGQLIGSYQTDRLFTPSGMEAQGKVLRIKKTGSNSTVTFVGYK